MVYGDSDLVVNQVMKEWDVRNPTMTTYFNAVRKLEKKFEGLELHHVLRLKNQAADELAKLGSTRRPVPSDASKAPPPSSPKKILLQRNQYNQRVQQIRLKSMYLLWLI
ncbi:hypothetical protein ZWY2020_033607 [Hordeum vulgare]|nr:hypothetical protein ZWY2020_033607 [Hordeum vulgare]